MPRVRAIEWERVKISHVCIGGWCHAILSTKQLADARRTPCKCRCDNFCALCFMLDSSGFIHNMARAYVCFRGPWAGIVSLIHSYTKIWQGKKMYRKCSFYFRSVATNAIATAIVTIRTVESVEWAHREPIVAKKRCNGIKTENLNTKYTINDSFNSIAWVNFQISFNIALKLCTSYSTGFSFGIAWLAGTLNDCWAGG